MSTQDAFYKDAVSVEIHSNGMHIYEIAKKSDGKVSRRGWSPGDDTSNASSALNQAAASIWTQDVIDSYKANMITSPFGRL